MDDRRFSEVLIRIRPGNGGPGHEYPVEAFIDGTGLWLGANAVLDPVDFAKVEDDAAAYGRLLSDRLLADEKLRSAIDQALGRSEGKLRLRLLIEDGATGALDLCWEKLRLRTQSGELSVATDPDTPFSRFLALEHLPLARIPDGVFNLLIAIASPDGLKPPLTPIDTAKEIDNVRKALNPMVQRGVLRVTLLARISDPKLHADLSADGWNVQSQPVTLKAVADAMRQHNGIHLIAHGSTTALLLEGAEAQMEACKHQLMVDACAGTPLRLAFIQACQSAIAEKDAASALSGLAAKVVDAGVPAVIAMQDFVRMQDARHFAHVFYEVMLAGGDVEAAANTGRKALMGNGSPQWHIPVLYSRLRDARLWTPDKLRDAIFDLSTRLRKKDEVEHPFPIEVVRSTTGIQYDLERGPSGARIPLLEASLAALEEAGAGGIVVLAGKHGRGKTAQLCLLYADLADKFMRGGPMPLIVKLKHLGQPAEITARSLLATAVSEAFETFRVSVTANQVAERLSGPIYLLVDGDEDIGNRARGFALANLDALRSECEHLTTYITFDEALLRAQPLPGEVTVLSIQPMAPGAVVEYLGKLPDSRGTELKNRLQGRSLFDLAEVPWLLSRLLTHSRPDRNSDSRSGIIGRIINENMWSVEWPAGLYPRAEDALSRIAWSAQSTRRTVLTGDDLYELLAHVRGIRDTPLERFRELLGQSKILCAAGEDGVRFAYPGFQSYWCARYLQAAQEKSEHVLEDITASLGRLARLRWWEDTLVLLAGLSDRTDTLVRQILAGSSLVEGDQILLAARCVSEAHLSGKSMGEDVIGQILDALVWRSHPQHDFEARSRIKAVEALGYLHCEGAIPHLVSLAIHPVRKTWEGGLTFDYSGVRQAAINALLLMPDQTYRYIQANGETWPATVPNHRDLIKLLDAWLRLDSAAISSAVSLRDPGLAAIAAFALSSIGGEANRKQLVDWFFDKDTKEDMRWAVSDALLRFSPLDVLREVVKPLLKLRPQMPLFAAYLIGKLGVTRPGDEEYEFLWSSLLRTDPRLQGTALKSLGMLGCEDVRTLCEYVATGQWDLATANGKLAAPGQARDWNRLQFYALEALRFVGNKESIEELRKARSRQASDKQKDHRTAMLRTQSFQVSEEIYWRITNGKSGESYGPPPAPEQASERSLHAFSQHT